MQKYILVSCFFLYLEWQCCQSSVIICTQNALHANSKREPDFPKNETPFRYICPAFRPLQIVIPYNKQQYGTHANL